MIVPHGIDESVRSFVDKAAIFKKYSVNVPNVYSYDLELGLILVEDFGDKIYQYNLQEDPDYFYEKAINELVNIQAIKKNIKILKLVRKIYHHLGKKLEEEMKEQM